MAKADPKETPQERFTYDRWQAGRLTSPGRGLDPDDTWVVDVVLVEEEEDEDLRALTRYRPQRGQVPDLGPVLDKAIRMPVDGDPHLPALVRVANEALAAEIRKARPEVRVVIGPTPLVEEMGRDFADDALPHPDDGEDHWSWLENGVTLEQTKRLFAAYAKVDLEVAEVLASGLNVVRVTVPSLGLEPGYAFVAVEEDLTAVPFVTVAIAPDKRTRRAWDEDESTEHEVMLFGLGQDELSPEAYRELVQHGLTAEAGRFPQVMAGGEDERPPRPEEVEMVIAVLEALGSLSLGDLPKKPRAVKLSSGADAAVSVPPDDVLAPSEDDEDDDDDDDDEHGDHDHDPDQCDVCGARVGDEDTDDVTMFLALDDARSWTAAPEPQFATYVAPPRPGRNDPCWCGSGVKYKKCHLDKDAGR